MVPESLWLDHCHQNMEFTAIKNEKYINIIYFAKCNIKCNIYFASGIFRTARNNIIIKWTPSNF